MKLLIGEKIQHYRKKNDMTQEDLANQIGVSPQAVSGWERNCGYPDITLLPGLSHALGITIDELMGNDEMSVRKDIEQFHQRFWQLNAREKLALATEYYRKYPEIYDIADTLVSVISGWGFAETPKYFTLMREAAERIIENCTDNVIRCRAIAAMSRYADDSEAERWLDMNPKMYSFIRGEIYEERLLNQGKYDEMRSQKYKNNVSLMLHVIARESGHTGNPEIGIEHNKYLRKLIRTFGENGEIPDGWMGKYAFITMRNAAGLFGAGRIDEGFTMLDEAMAAYKKQFALPDDVPLSLGAPGFFGDITVTKHMVAGLCDTFSVELDGESYYMQNPPYLYSVLTCRSGWEWFDCVREDERFLKVAAEAKAMHDKWIAMWEKMETEDN